MIQWSTYQKRKKGQKIVGRAPCPGTKASCRCNRVLVDGLRRVLSYTPERLVLQVGKRRVTLVGADLCLLDYSPLGVQVIGTLLAVEFGDL